MTVALAAKDDLLVHQRVAAVTVFLREAHVDRVVVFSVFEGANFPAKQRRPQRVSNVARAQPIGAGFFSVDDHGHLGFPLVDVNLQLFHPGVILDAEVTKHLFRSREQLVVIVPCELQVDGRSLGWSVGIFGHHHFRIGVAPKLFADGAQHIACGQSAAVLEFDKVDDDARLVGRRAQLRALVGVAGSVAHRANDRVDQKALSLTRFRVGALEFVACQHLHHLDFNVLGHLVGLR